MMACRSNLRYIYLRVVSILLRDYVCHNVSEGFQKFSIVLCLLVDHGWANTTLQQGRLGDHLQDADPPTGLASRQNSSTGNPRLPSAPNSNWQSRREIDTILMETRSAEPDSSSALRHSTISRLQNAQRISRRLFVGRSMHNSEERPCRSF